jgi:hypothetical protein
VLRAASALTRIEGAVGVHFPFEPRQEGGTRGCGVRRGILYLCVQLMCRQPGPKCAVTGSGGGCAMALLVAGVDASPGLVTVRCP